MQITKEEIMETILRGVARLDDAYRLTMKDPARLLWWILRIAAAMCYVGHGAFGVIGREAWLPFFALVGIGPETAWTLMPVVGMVDIVLGISVLIAPRRIVLLYMAVWAVWTASLRPLSGDSFFEMLERAGNYGIPIAMLVLVGGARSVRDWFAALDVPTLEPRRAARAGVVLVWTTALLLVGHGALAAIDLKPLLAEHAAAIGFGPGAAVAAGWLELALGLLVLAHPRIRLLLVIAIWKVATEALFPIAGAPMWEFIERGGSYAAPIALALLVAWERRLRALSPATVPATGSTTGVPRASHVPAAVVIAALVLGAALPAAAQAQRVADRTSSGRVCSSPKAAAAFAARARARATATNRTPAPDSARPSATARPGAGFPFLDDAPLIAALRSGGHILVCRHTKTDHSAGDTGPTRAQQRNLDAEGERQARAMGAAIRALGIPIGDVRSSPRYRTRETSELAFGRTELDTRLRGPGAPDSLRRMISRPPPGGTNQVLMTHTGILNRVFEGHGIGRLEEGGCAVMRPLGAEGFLVVRRIDIDEWERLRRPAPAINDR